MLEELYKQRIIDLYNAPPHKKNLLDATHQANGNNPTCGDLITIQAIVKDNCIVDISYTGEGCAISQAALNLLINEIVGKNITDIISYTFEDVQTLLGVDISHARSNCATLGLRTCQKMFDGTSN